MVGTNPFEENTTAWLSTTASQIFFMQLGFLAYEVGFCKPVWTQSLILKNVEDTFVGVLIFLCFGYTLSQSENSFYGIIAIPTNPFLIGIDSHLHDQILIAAFFASTCATIISGAVLERMKNKVYVVWCLLIILVNYSFISHWVWHKDGWLHKLGFVDGAGAVVVHSTAGMASFVAVWRLGNRKESIGENGELLPIESASRPIINAMGAFFLWYGWFAFNVSSPIAFSKGIGDAIGTTAMVTVVSPISAACCSFIIMHYINIIPLTFENLLNCLLAGLVTITGPCHTCNIWEAAFIGFSSSILYFIISYIIRYKWHIDDPLHVITIHLFCGLYSCITEGIVGNNVYGTPGLMYGGFKHFGVQLLGVIVIATFNLILSIFLWDIIMKKCLFRNRTDFRVSILDIYLGTRIFDQNYNMALEEVLKCESNAGKKMLWQFHQYVEDRFALEQLNFLIVSKILFAVNKDGDSVKNGKYIIQIVDTYIDEMGAQCINISHTQRAILLKFKNQLLLELNQVINEEDVINRKPSMTQYNTLDISKENIFEDAYNETKRIVVPLFTQFLKYQFKKDKQKKFAVKIPFILKKNWMLEWDKILTKEINSMKLKDTIPDIVELINTVNPTKRDKIHSVSEYNQCPINTTINIQYEREKDKETKENMEFVIS